MKSSLDKHKGTALHWHVSVNQPFCSSLYLFSNSRSPELKIKKKNKVLTTLELFSFPDRSLSTMSGSMLHTVFIQKKKNPV